jgi:hypothetical protein
VNGLRGQPDIEKYAETGLEHYSTEGKKRIWIKSSRLSKKKTK